MLLKQIDNELYEVKSQISNLRKQLRDLESKRDSLLSAREYKQLDYFTQFIEIDSEFEFSSWTSLSVQFVSQKPTRQQITTHGNSIYFNRGDSIKILKKNNKSIVCQYSKKDGKPLSLDIRFRVDKLQLMGQFFTVDGNLERFEKFVTRCESMEALEI